MLRTRAAGLLLLLCIAAVGWHLTRQPAPAPATPAAATSTAQAQPPWAAASPSTGATAATSAAAEPAPGAPSAPTTPLAVTPRPTATPVRADVPQDHGTSPRPAPGPDQRRVEADEPSVDQLTDAQLQDALDRQTAGQGRLQPALEHAAAAAAWQQVEPTLTAARTWSHIERRAAVALLLGQHTDPTQPIPVNVITTWTGTDLDGLTGVHRAETKLLYLDNTWQPLN